MLIDHWRYTVRAYRPQATGGGLEWHKSFTSGAERDRELLAAAMDIRDRKLEMLVVESRVEPMRRKMTLRSLAAVQAWVQKFGSVLR
jgi:hypothetical protein